MLPKSNRLRDRRDFAAVYTRKRFWANTHLVLYHLPHTGTCRWGLSVSKKVGKAHDRNRIKRRLRELCRANYRMLQGDFILVVRPAATSLTFSELSATLDELFAHAGVFPVEPHDDDPSTNRLASPD